VPIVLQNVGFPYIFKLYFRHFLQKAPFRSHSLRPAEVDKNPLEDEDRTSAAQDSERLTRQQAEETARQRVTKEGLQHSLHVCFCTLYI